MKSKDVEIAMPPATPEHMSRETVRRFVNAVNKKQKAEALHGALYAERELRAIGRLHTAYVGQRSEYDWTKYIVYLYPNPAWDLPLPYFTGFGIDHYSRVKRGFATALFPSRRAIVRLYKRCVLPKYMWLPPQLAADFGVFGTEEIAVIDNAMDLTANSSISMFLSLGVIVLRVPPYRGDLKGTIERDLRTTESQFVSALPGYRPYIKNSRSPEAKAHDARARREAKLTVAEYEERLASYCNEANLAPHPTLRAPRMRVWEDGVARYPTLLPTGRIQLRTTFALTIETSLTRMGVVANGLQYQSQALHEKFLTWRGGKVRVKQDPDDIRSVLVYTNDQNEPIEAHYVTHQLHGPTSLELLKVQLEIARTLQGEPPEKLAVVLPELLERVNRGEHEEVGIHQAVAADMATRPHTSLTPPAAQGIAVPPPGSVYEDLDASRLDS
ncbi:MAG: Mu transposase C-terminal domain-containing protein [Pseudomonadota bacterium]